jgi:hypothetical protein
MTIREGCDSLILSSNSSVNTNVLFMFETMRKERRVGMDHMTNIPIGRNVQGHSFCNHGKLNLLHVVTTKLIFDPISSQAQ